MQAVDVDLLVVACVIAVAVTEWIVVWLFLSRLGQSSASSLARTLRVAHAAIVALPMACLAATGALVLRAFLRIGEWPHGSEPVFTGAGLPEWREANIDAGWFELHYLLVHTLAVAAFLSVLVFPPLHVVVRRGGSAHANLALVLYASGFVAFAAVMIGDVGGVAEWLDG
jgi:hypothetical protein